MPENGYCGVQMAPNNFCTEQRPCPIHNAPMPEDELVKRCEHSFCCVLCGAALEDARLTAQLRDMREVLKKVERQALSPNRSPIGALIDITQTVRTALADKSGK